MVDLVRTMMAFSNDFSLVLFRREKRRRFEKMAHREGRTHWSKTPGLRIREVYRMEFDPFSVRLFWAFSHNNILRKCYGHNRCGTPQPHQLRWQSIKKEEKKKREIKIKIGFPLHLLPHPKLIEERAAERADGDLYPYQHHRRLPPPSP